MKHLLLYAALAVAWLVALRREAARIRYLRWLDRWAKDLEDFAARAVTGLAQMGITFAEASDRMTDAAAAWVTPATTISATTTTLPRMTSAGDAAGGMTLDELLGDIDDLIDEGAST